VEVQVVVNRIVARLDPWLAWPRAIRIGADRVYVDSADRALRALSWKLGFYGRAERALLSRLVRPGMVVVDAGANVGLCTVELARRVGAHGRVYAIEPEARNFRLLTRTLSESRLGAVEARQVAVADCSGWMSLYVSPLDRGDHRIFPADDDRKVTTVRAVTLDEVLADEPRVDLILLDVCGAEAAVLRGVRRTLERNPEIGVLCQVRPELLRRAGAGAETLFAPLRDAGLLAYRLLPGGSTPPVGETSAWQAAAAGGGAPLYFTRARR